MRSGEKIRLGMFLRPCGHHIASWRHPQSQADAGENFEHFVHVAKTAERGLFDMLFSADTPTVFTAEEEGLERSHYVAWIEPFSLLAALAPHTKNIGLVCTASTSFEEPYSIARKFASLDIISHGRAGWNVVTTGNPVAAQNYGEEPHLPKIERYRKAREFLDVVNGLWDSWDADAFIRNRDTGIFFERSKMHELNFHGDYYHVRGPLNVPRSPQGKPVVVQAGASDEGRDLAAATADVVFTAHETLESAKEFYADVKGRMSKYGRHPDQLKIMPGLFVTVAPSEDEAREKFQVLQDLIHPEIGVSLIERKMGIDLSGFDIDGPLPPVPPSTVLSSRVDQMIATAKRDGLTIRGLYQRFAASRGHFAIVGSPQQVADHMQLWFEEGAADGFNFMAPIFPGGLEDFVDLVVPELQKRGLFRIRYEGRMLRTNLGLST
jgi:N-acetyl-S-(2-succino)cysteine monooxygenase